MAGTLQSPAARVAALVARMPHVPGPVAATMAEASVAGRFTARGGPAALERFYAHLHSTGRAPQAAQAEDFAAAATSRTALITLMKALALCDPSVPLAVAQPLRQEWDQWLNARFNVKPKKPRASTRVARLPGDWPAPWQAGLRALDRAVRVRGRRYGRLAPRTRAAIVQAVGMCAAARAWGIAQGVPLDDTISEDLAEVFLRYLLLERGRAGSAVSVRSAADYVERVMLFTRRADLLSSAAEATFGEIKTALEAEATDRTPGKHAKVRAFMATFQLGDILRAASAALDTAGTYPAHSAAAFRLRRTAAVFALLVNGVDRQGDLSTLRIGREIVRHADGSWEADFRQSKTRCAKDLGPYWPEVSRILDAHVLAGRPAWRMDERLAELDGYNLLSLAPEGFDIYHPSALLREQFGISGHLVRTLVTNLLRTHRPDAAWAAKELLGHSGRWMQQTYLTDFRESAAIAKYHGVLAELTG